MSFKYKPKIFVIMGVSGCGKSTVAAKLASQLQCPFYDADDYHTQACKDKMHSGIPLSDEDRWPWLERLQQLLVQHLAGSTPAVLACSALKPTYRQLLRSACQPATPWAAEELQRDGPVQTQQLKTELISRQPTAGMPQLAQPQGDKKEASCPQQIAFVLLNPPRSLLQARLEKRVATGTHFMPASLLDSQLQDLDVPDPAELFMCFGHHPGTEDIKSDPEHGNQAVLPVYREQHGQKHADVSSRHCIDGGSIAEAGYKEGGSVRDAAGPFPTADDIVAAIVSNMQLPTASC